MEGYLFVDGETCGNVKAIYDLKTRQGSVLKEVFVNKICGKSLFLCFSLPGSYLGS